MGRGGHAIGGGGVGVVVVVVALRMRNLNLNLNLSPNLAYEELLSEGHAMQPELDTEVSPRDHQPIGESEDLR